MLFTKRHNHLQTQMTLQHLTKGKKILFWDNIADTRAAHHYPVPSWYLPYDLTWRCKGWEDSGLREEWNSRSVLSPGACPVQHVQHPDCWLNAGGKATGIMLVDTISVLASHLPWNLHKRGLVQPDLLGDRHAVQQLQQTGTILKYKCWNDFTRKTSYGRRAGLVPWYN